MVEEQYCESHHELAESVGHIKGTLEGITKRQLPTLEKAMERVGARLNYLLFGILLATFGLVANLLQSCVHKGGTP